METITIGIAMGDATAHSTVTCMVALVVTITSDIMKATLQSETLIKIISYGQR